MNKEISLNEQQIEFIKWHMDTVLDESISDYSETSKAIALSIINELEK